MGASGIAISVVRFAACQSPGLNSGSLNSRGTENAIQEIKECSEKMDGGYWSYGSANWLIGKDWGKRYWSSWIQTDDDIC